MSVFGNPIREEAEEQNALLEEVVIQEAVDLNLLDSDGTEIDLLQERRNLTAQTKRVKVSRDQKIRNLAKRTALELARRDEDPLFRKWRKLQDQARAVRDQIDKKYSAKAKSKVKEVIKSSSESKRKDVPGGRRTT